MVEDGSNDPHHSKSDVQRVKERRHYSEDCLQDEDIEGRRLFSVHEKLSSPKFGPYFVRELKGEEFSLKYIQEHGFDQPLLFKDKTGLGMRIPNENFTVNDVRQYVGNKRLLDVMDVSTQRDVEMTMKDWARYYENPVRDRLYNVISLEFSHTRMEPHVEAPTVVRQLDWVDLAWPRNLKEGHSEATVEDVKYPKVQNGCNSSTCSTVAPPMTQVLVSRYCLMSVKGCYTDFHIDFGGSSVWYHIFKGQKVTHSVTCCICPPHILGCQIFWLIPPTEKNLLLYEKWVLSGKQSDIFFGDTVEQCARISLSVGDTFFIPSGEDILRRVSFLKEDL
ncbi:KDM2A [Cordylochernes scorpioides]|uniref:KDM2A n=1 Tax=Cordylochernes scorpioides TaxID=51811 RepID=A0ABY6KHC0_9ARAC|nr:KDM2A [Cordylochernes scorpioides]